MLPKPKLLIFDVNETLLDLSPLKDEINKELENLNAFDLWFSQLLQYSLLETITGNYRDFGEIGKATLKMTALKFNKELSEENCDRILANITKLPAHKDVSEGLEMLKQSGFKLVAFTNGGLKTVHAQLKFAKIDHFFDDILSVESIQKFKPHPDTYQFVLNKFDCNPHDAMLIAAHGWDVTGAMRAGLQASFVNRPGKFPYPLENTTRYTGRTLVNIAEDLTKL